MNTKGASTPRRALCDNDNREGRTATDGSQTDVPCKNQPPGVLVMTDGRHFMYHRSFVSFGTR